ncbi:MAG: ribokinase [Bacilli bacterium]
MADIYILGSLNMDLVVYLNRYPQKGETIKGHSFRTGAGGKGLNQAIAASKLGGHVHFLGAVGHDIFGEAMKKQLLTYGVDIASVKTREDISSGVALIEVCQGENEIALDLGANETISASEIAAFFAEAKPDDIFLTQGENNLAAMEKSLQKAHEIGLTTILNPAPANGGMKRCFGVVDYLTPNETEAALLTGSPRIEEAGPRFGVPHVIITLGGKGYYDYSAEESYQQNAIKVDVVDTTGAGDAFCGAFANFLAENISRKDALHLASIYASLKTTRKGSSAAMPTREEFKDFLTKNEARLASLIA